MPDWRPTCSVAALQARAEIFERIRAFFRERGVVEVHTPTMGATSVTEPDIDSMRLEAGGWLQTSPEYYMKRLLAAGAPSIYQLGTVYRAGERGRLHNPEFTMLEWYRLGFDDAELMDEVADLVDHILGPGSYRTLRYSDLVQDLTRPREELDLAFADAVAALRGDGDDGGGGDERVFITDYPADQAALAQVRSNNPSVAARFELAVQGVELANGYHELGDAGELRRRFEQDNAVRRERQKPLMEIDEPFLGAMESGLPPCAGVALGVDRLVMLALGAESLAEVMLFAEG